MALDVIGAGLGRTATFTLKFALEHIGFGPCYHMAENFANARRHIPLWLDVIDGKPDWDAIFDGYRSTTDYPACTYWRELADYYPQAKVILTVRDPDSWFDSVSATIFSQAMNGNLGDSPFGRVMQGAVFGPFGGHDITDRTFMTDWFRKRNQDVIDTIPPERLLVFNPKDGWEPLCAFLGAPVPSEKFPRINSRDELEAASGEKGGLPPSMEGLETFAHSYLAELRAKAFP